MTYDQKGSIDGVRYDRIGVLLINVMREQQGEIETQKKKIAALTEALCAMNPAARVCTEKEK